MGARDVNRQDNGLKLHRYPPQHDLRDKFTQVEDQGYIGACTANACMGVAEYYMRAILRGRTIDLSRLFVYKTTRNLLGWTGDSGGTIRSAILAMRMFGAPPESYMPYTDVEPDYDIEPTPFIYMLAQNFAQNLYAYRIDRENVTPAMVMDSTKLCLLNNRPLVFGTSMYSSIDTNPASGEIPYPAPEEENHGGHAMCIVGYDDTKKITNAGSGVTTTGAFVVRNSWGVDWGESGYGWLPYKYIETKLATDIWDIGASAFIDIQTILQ